MADKHTDLSKLPEQDFANPSLLKELVEVQTELKMAKDALTKKTADIAVPLEQLGAEMAKEMTTNIEKWLPDTPDRERWSQEEPLTDDMKEAPMAELPKEMEDIVGKLMEDEEDLFNEMEDASSSWADSLDKGAGWDAMDGPISNNSARGVTGNRLPNTSEIAGRSGEGRQGKSSGEFVGDTAVGKGGRKTPSRLTPDAFVKGQVKDYSKDPVGGATGGGKESGAGGEGLHGPVPNRPERDMGRLATKQAQLRNKAEGVDLRFKVLKYHHNDLKRMIDVMAAVEGDLKAGRYRNALRRRDVLIEGLGEVKTYLKGEFTIRQDQTANLPTDIQKEILGSMQEPSPPRLGRAEQAVLRAADDGPGPDAGSGGREARDGGTRPEPSPAREEVSDHAFRQDRPPEPRRVVSTDHAHARPWTSRNPRTLYDRAGRGLHCPLGRSRGCPAPGLRLPQEVVIPFDFESKFDNGEYGQTIGDMLWAKLHRQGGFVIPESMQDVRDWCQRNPHDPWARDDAGEDEGGRRQGTGRRHRHLGQDRTRAGLRDRRLRPLDQRRRLLGGPAADGSTRRRPAPGPSARSPISTSRRRSTASMAAPNRSPGRRSRAPEAVGEGPQSRQGRLRARPSRAGRLGPPAPRRHLGCGERQGRESRQSDHPLHA